MLGFFLSHPSAALSYSIGKPARRSLLEDLDRCTCKCIAFQISMPNSFFYSFQETR